LLNSPEFKKFQQVFKILGRYWWNQISNIFIYIQREIQNLVSLLLFALHRVEALWEEREREWRFQIEEPSARRRAHTMEVPKDQIATLLENGLYNSAQMLVIFILLFLCFQFVFEILIPHKKWLFFIYLWVWALIWSLCDEQGCFLVSSPAANAESAPHLKTESLVSAIFHFKRKIIILFCNF